jgi:hypothetical protein
MTIRDNTPSKITVTGDMEVNGSIYCIGNITYEDIEDYDDNIYKDRISKNLNTKIILPSDVIIEGDIILNKKYYDKYNIYEIIKSTNNLPTSINTSQLTTFMSDTTIIWGKMFMNNLFTNNDKIILSLRKEKIKKVYNKN